MLQLFVNQFTTDLYHWWQPLICPCTILQIYICNSYTMGTSALSDIYTQARG